MNSRLSRLNRNLLLLAKIDNSQFDKTETINLTFFFNEHLPLLESLANGIEIKKVFLLHQYVSKPTVR